MQSDKLRVRRRAASMLTMALAPPPVRAAGVGEWAARTLGAGGAPPGFGGAGGPTGWGKRMNFPTFFRD